jgi:pimeloyl-ACP methyl ester carboxylesterase/DNA-binding CsgD family transcriptional regulator/class 3 adenylate cyclase
MALRTRYARSGDLSIAYQVIGDGPIDLVHAPPYISHLEYAWEDPSFAHYLHRLAAFSRLILFDKRGTGLSDRVAGVAPLAERMDDVRAVMDAVGSEQAVLYGMSESTPLALLFAATYPERTAALVLYGAYASETWASDYPWSPTAEELTASLDAMAGTIHEDWGSGDDLAFLAPTRMNDAAFRTWFSTYQRLSASPGAVIDLARMNAIIDVRHVLSAIHVPTLVLCRRGTGDSVVEQSRYVASHVAGAQLVELPGVDYLPYVGDADALVDEIEAFVTGTRPTAVPNSVLATVLTIEIADPAGQALALGNRRWGELQQRFQELLRRELIRFQGRMQDHSGDRIVATFDGPARAIQSAVALSATTRELGLVTRTGLHVGECELRDGRVSGTAVPLSAWVADQAMPGEILVTSTVRDLVSGAGLPFADLGVRSVGAGAGEWRLYAVRAEADPGLTPLLVPAGAEPPRVTLTRRENDVLPLVARGLTNQQIADALSISERTVESHVSSILAKWGLTSRTQLAAVATGVHHHHSVPQQR